MIDCLIGRGINSETGEPIEETISVAVLPSIGDTILYEFGITEDGLKSEDHCCFEGKVESIFWQQKTRLPNILFPTIRISWETKVKQLRF